MAKTKKKNFKVKEEDAVVPKGSYKDIDWEGQEIEFHSDELKGGDSGHAVVIRFFDYKANASQFKLRPVTAQELFNIHTKQIELELWKDGLKAFTEIPVQLVTSKDKSHYRFIVSALPIRGQTVSQAPQTLTEILNEARTNSV